MKKGKLLFLFLFVFFAFSCEKIEYEPFDFDEEIETTENVTSTDQLLITTQQGFNSHYHIYIQKDKDVKMEISSLKGEEIKDAQWKIEENSYQGLVVSHKFDEVKDVSISVTATQSDGQKKSQVFEVSVVEDIKKHEPVQIFSEPKSAGTFAVTLLFNLERLNGKDLESFYCDGNIFDWEKKQVSGDSGYIIEDDKATKVQSGAKYVGIEVTLKTGFLYNAALVDDLGNWLNLSGSSYLRNDNPGLIWFQLNKDGDIISEGEVYNL
ncbi:MAG: hypothetical protein EOL97_15030 [Spirochaetia bacterium]|nr:hypothetical protein [Spirochaetia bacterium]